jgi:hypothetical protein
MNITKDIVSEMYYDKKLSMRDIAKELGITRGQVETLMEKWGIERRSNSDAQKVIGERVTEERADETVSKIRRYSIASNVQTKFAPTFRKNILVPYPVEKGTKDAYVTVVLSDLHIGDGNHLPECFWSTVDNTVKVLQYIKGVYKIKGVIFVLNGDIVNGNNIYKFQEFRNLIQRGHWQVFLAEVILKEVIDRINKVAEIKQTFFVRGTHENLDANPILYLKRVMPGFASYLSHGGLVNIAGDLGEYNVIFSHGSGYSVINPISVKFFDDMIRTINSYKNKGIQTDRVCSSHSHWLSTGLILEDIYWDVTGGFQKWEYTMAQRPCGAIIYLYNNGECVSIPVRPNPEVEQAEKSDNGLEYRNLGYYSTWLLKHLKTIEKVDT